MSDEPDSGTSTARSSSGRLTAAADNGRLRLWLAGFLLLALFATAWVHDDAFISFRSVDNFVEGRGLTWNDGERVQVFTHPLWFFIHAAAYSVTGEPYYTTLLICFACSLLAVYLLAFRLPASPREGALALAAVLLSIGFLDYSTSGLENPLTHLLIGLIVAAGWYPATDRARSLPLLALLTSLALLNRLDLLPLLLPGFALQLWRASARQRARAVAILGLPLLAWESFSLIYFGFLVPNSAPAKLSTGISLLGKLAQSVNYFASNLIHDGFTVLFAGFLALILWRHGSAQGRAAVCGVALHATYLMTIGGEYMSSRALTAPFVLLLFCVIREGILRVHPPRPRTWLAIGVAAMLVRAVAALAFPAVDPFGIGDERRVWHPHTGLLYAAASRPWPNPPSWRYVPGEDCDIERCVASDIVVGLLGYYSGPEVYVVDRMAIGDAFRARLPGIRGGNFNIPGRLNWRPGHVERPLPAGFLASVESGQNRITDPDLAEYYDAIVLITSGDLWSRERWREIWKVNTGAYDRALEAWAQSNPTLFLPQPS